MLKDRKLSLDASMLIGTAMCFGGYLTDLWWWIFGGVLIIFLACLPVEPAPANAPEPLEEVLVEVG